MVGFDTTLKENLTRESFTGPGQYLCVISGFSWHISTLNLSGIEVTFECVHRPLRAVTRKIYMFEGRGTSYTSGLLQAHGVTKLKTVTEDMELTGAFGNKLVAVTLRNGQPRPGGGFFLDVASVQSVNAEAKRLARDVGYWNGDKPEGTLLVFSRERATQSTMGGDEYSNRYGESDEIPG